MKRKIINLILLVSLLFTPGTVLQFCNTASAAGKVFADRYNFDDLKISPVEYDLNGDGIKDVFSVNTYSTYSESVGDYCIRIELVINGQAYFIGDRRHGYYEDVFITDIDQTDNFIDIILIDDYKGKGAAIYRYDGQEVIGLTSDDGYNYFSVWTGYWDSVFASQDTEPTVDIAVSNSNTGSIGFTFSCGGEKHSYIKNTDINYIETDIDFFEQTYNETDVRYEDEIKVFLNGERLTFDQPPIIIGDRTMVPIRAIFEAMGYTVDWNQDTQTATAINGNDRIVTQIGNSDMSYTVNGVSNTYYCDVVPQIVSERTLVPVRAIAECAGCNVAWDGKTHTVYIASQKNPKYYEGFEHVISFDNFCGYPPHSINEPPQGNFRELQYDAANLPASVIENYIYALLDEGYIFWDSSGGPEQGQIRYGLCSANDDDSYNDIVVIYSYTKQSVSIAITLVNNAPVG